MKRRAFIKLGGQVTVAGTVLTQLSACSSDDDDVRLPNNLDGLDDLDDRLSRRSTFCAWYRQW